MQINTVILYKEKDLAYNPDLQNNTITYTKNKKKQNKKHKSYGWAVYPASQILFTECVGNHFRPHKIYASIYYIRFDKNCKVQNLIENITYETK